MRFVAGLAAVGLVATACSSGNSTGATTVLTPSVNSFIVGTSTTPPPTSIVIVTTLPPAPETSSTSSTSSTSTTDPGVESVTIVQGDFLTENRGSCTPTTCKRVNISTSGWPPRALLDITCYSSYGTTGPYQKYADKDGRFSSSTLCFYGNAKNVYVVINGVSSNIVEKWKDW